MDISPHHLYLNATLSGIEPDPLLSQRAPYTKGPQGSFLHHLPPQHCFHVPKRDTRKSGQWLLFQRNIIIHLNAHLNSNICSQLIHQLQFPESLVISSYSGLSYDLRFPVEELTQWCLEDCVQILSTLTIISPVASKQDGIIST